MSVCVRTNSGTPRPISTKLETHMTQSLKKILWVKTLLEFLGGWGRKGEYSADVRVESIILGVVDVNIDTFYAA